jgi:antitoxin component of MazEF toxin-antitoxin module
MIKSITKIGNSQGLIFDSALLDLARLKAGDRVDLTVHEGGTITLTPIRPTIGPQKAAVSAKRLIRRNSELFRRLS